MEKDNIIYTLRTAMKLSQTNLSKILSSYLKQTIVPNNFKNTITTKHLNRNSVSQADISELESDDPHIRLQKSTSLYFVIADFFHISVNAILKNDLSDSNVQSILRIISANKFTNYNIHSNSYVEKALRCKEIGSLGEEWVLELEQKNHRACNTGYENKIIPYFRIDDNKGYDILSYTFAGIPIYIEVKSTVAGQSTNFYISKSEVNTARRVLANGGQYIIYRIVSVENEKKRKLIKIPVTESFFNHLEPTHYEFIA